MRRARAHESDAGTRTGCRRTTDIRPAIGPKQRSFPPRDNPLRPMSQHPSKRIQDLTLTTVLGEAVVGASVVTPALPHAGTNLSTVEGTAS